MFTKELIIEIANGISKYRGKKDSQLAPITLPYNGTEYISAVLNGLNVLLDLNEITQTQLSDFAEVNTFSPAFILNQDVLNTRFLTKQEGNNIIVRNNSSFQVLEDRIELLVSKETFDLLNDRVTKAESSIILTAELILLMVSKEDFDNLNKRIILAESSITQQADLIALKVSKEEFDNLSGLVREALSAIIQNSDEIALKVSTNDFSKLTLRMTSAESLILQNSDQILLKVNETDFDNLTNRLTNAESSITLTADSIKSKVSKLDFDILNNTVKSSLSQITQLSDKIESVVSVDVGDLEDRLTQAESKITQLSDLISSKVSLSTFNNLSVDFIASQQELANTKKAVADAQADALEANRQIAEISDDNILDSIEKKSVLKEWLVIQDEYSTLISLANTYLVSTSDYTAKYNTLNTYITPLLANLTNSSVIVGDTFRSKFKDYYNAKVALLKSITDKVKIVTDSLGTRVSLTESSITLLAGLIATKVSQTDFNTLGTRVAVAESSISQTPTQISTAVSNIQIGGTNLLRNTGVMTNFNYWDWGAVSVVTSNRTITSDGDMKITITASTGGGDSSLKQTTPTFNATTDGYVTISTEVVDISGTNIMGQLLIRCISEDGSYSDLTSKFTTNGKKTFTRALRGNTVRFHVWFSLYPTVAGGTGSITYRNCKLELGNKATDWSPSPLDIDDSINAVNTDLTAYKTSNNSSITQLSNSIATKVETSTFNALGTRVSSAESTITQHTNSLATKVESSTFNALGTRVSAAESAITQLPNKITLAVSEISIGGANILKNTRLNVNFAGNGTAVTNDYLGLTSVYGVRPSSGYTDPLTYGTIESIKPDTYYTLSFYIKGENNTDLVTTYLYPGTVATGVNSQGNIASLGDGAINFKVSTEWQRVWVTYKTLSSTSGAKTVITHRMSSSQGVVGNKVWVCGVKLEEGNKATDWTANEMDVLGLIDNSQTTANIAVTNAAIAQTSANSANTLANTANTLATTANSTANTAKTNAATAQTTANTAQTTANSKTTLSEVTASMTITSNGFTFNGKTFIVNSTILALAIQTAKLSVGSKFSVGTDGTLIASGATINGTITATAGTIGGWTLASSYLKSNLSTWTGTYGTLKTYSLLNSNGTFLIYDDASKILVLLSPKSYSEYNDRDAGALVFFSSTGTPTPMVLLSEGGLEFFNSAGATDSILSSSLLKLGSNYFDFSGLILKNIPTSSSGLSAGRVYRNGNLLMIV